MRRIASLTLLIGILVGLNTLHTSVTLAQGTPIPNPVRNVQPITPANASQLKNLAILYIPDPISALRWSPDSNLLALCCWQGMDLIAIDKIGSGHALQPIKTPGYNPDSMAFSPDGSTLALGTAEGTVLFMNLNTNKISSKLENLPAISDIAFGGGSSLLGYSSDDGEVAVLWDLKAGRELAKFNTKLDHSPLIALNATGTLFAYSDFDHSNLVHIWNIETHKEQALLDLGHEVEFNSLAFSPDGTLLETAEGSGAVNIWDAQTGQNVKGLFPGTPLEVVTAAGFSMDGTLVAGAADAHSVVIFDMKTNQQLVELKGHKTSVTSIAFSPDGKLMVSGDQDGKLWFWGIKQ